MRNLLSDKVAVFKCNQWLSKSHEDGQLVRELPAEIEGKKVTEGRLMVLVESCKTKL